MRVAGGLPRVRAKEAAVLEFLVLVFGCITFVLLPGSLGRAATPVTPISSPGLGFDIHPEGPSIPIATIRKSEAEGAVVTAAGKSFRVRFPKGERKPRALFSFKALDLTERMGMACNITNAGREPVRVYGEMNENMWVAGYIVVPPGQTRTLYIFLQRKEFSPADADAAFKGMNGIPGGEMKLWPEAEIDPAEVSSLAVFLVLPQSAAEIEVSNLRPFGSTQPPDEKALAGDFFPFIDRYGQLKYKDWPGKVHSDEDLKAAVRAEAADLAAHQGSAGLDEYGGWAAGPRLQATAHFRVEKYQGKWWLVDPQGRLFWSNGMDCVRFDMPTRIEGRERYFEAPAPAGDFLARNLEIKYGKDWRSAVLDLLGQRFRSWRINSIGAWSEDVVMEQHKVPYTVIFHSGDASGKKIAPESAEWSEALRRQLTQAASRLNSDPWCIGFFVDNEIHASKDPAWWEAYYHHVSGLAKEILPNKLYLGSRLDFHDFPDSAAERIEIARLAARYTDVVSFNQYRFTLDEFHWPAGIDRPVIVGEFHFGALDRGLLHTGLRVVVNQGQRADAYRHFVTSALLNPLIVGAHWFQLYDEPTAGRGDGENYQIGFLDVCDQPYAETVAASRDVGYRLYQIRNGGM